MHRSPSEPEARLRRTLAFRSVSTTGKRYLVLLHTVAPPDMAEWQAYLEAVNAALAESKTLVHVFVVTDGGGPSAPQRKALADVMDGRQTKLLTHVFTTDRMVRGIVTAFRWIARSAAVAHLPSEFMSVCAETDLRFEEVFRTLKDVQKDLTRVRTLALLQGSMRAPRPSSRR